MSSVRRALRRTGFDIVRFTPSHTFAAQRATLIHHHRLDLAIDVGANIGQWATGMRGDGYQGRIVSFEPQRDAFETLAARAAEDPNWDTHRLALGAEAGSARLNVAGNSQSSSILPMLDRHLEAAPESAYVGTETVEVRPLDDVLPEIVGTAQRSFLKLDVQGLERQVLDGAAATLPQIVGLQIESSLVGLYDGEALFPEMLARLASTGFVLAAVKSVFFDDTTGQTLSLDALFFRS